MPVSVVWLLVVFAVSAVGTVWVVWRERRRPSSYRSRFEAEMAEWRALPTEVQAARDEAALHAGEAAERAAARANSLYRP
ncbi:hypothetical protein OIE75_41235 (plasmid) [Streptomyces sp. NBC_01723]|uniref:hypothetical protein n=1 Tax=Streptomyces sp. NBC_01723 TaxID=2975921 RepID=UPI002E2F23E4|nr:hypothetical protein [Streptomyces sp. NBC_01723]